VDARTASGRWWGLVVLPAAVLAAGAAACKKSEAEGSDAARAVPVEVRVVGRGTVREVARFVGEVRPSAKVNVLPRMAEKILALGFEEGDFVTQDETVMAQLATARVDTGVRQARSGAEALTAQINGLRTQQARLRRLVADGVVSASQLDTIDAQIAALEAQRRQVLAGVDQANLVVEDTIVKAPLTGWVAQRFVEVGDMVSPATPLATIVRLDPVFVWVDVPEHEVELVRKQPGTHVHVEVAPDREFPARIDLVSPTVDRESRSVRFRYRVDNPELVLRDGMLARVDVELQRREDVLVVPSAALILDPTQRGGRTTYTAYVVNGEDRAHRVSVARGLVEGDRAEVLSGLAEGERLVVQGFQLLEEGTLVEVVGGGAGAATAGAVPAEAGAPADAGAGPADEAGAGEAGGDAGGDGR
jgi:RND family efflux transporter MFP subunit